MKVWKEGGCHCGSIRFKVRSSFDRVLECNCSICFKKGYLHLIVPAADFRLLAGEEKLSLYQFNTKTAKHFFCSICGIAPYYVPRSHPDGFDVNLRCVEKIDWQRVKLEPFDGSRWEDSVPSIQGYS